MRVQTEEWRRFVPGVRMYKGEMTLFWNGEKLWEGGWGGNPLVYNKDERNSWQVILVLPGVEVIPKLTFSECEKLKTVIMSDTVRKIEDGAFANCKSLGFVKLSRTLEFVGESAFWFCQSLTSIFFPPFCRQIGEYAFHGCKQLLILGMPQNVQLGGGVFQDTALMEKSPLEIDEDGYYDYDDEEVVQWIGSINNGAEHALHRACSSFNPLCEIIHELVIRKGIDAMTMKNAIGITPSQYLAANTFATVSEIEIINKYILDMMGEIV